MKITFVVSGNVRSNFSHRAVALARALRKLGNEVSIIAPSADKYNNFKQERIDSINGVKIIQPFQFRTARLEINLLPYLFGAAKAVLREKPDLIYIYKPTPISIVGFAAKLLHRTPVVLDLDDLGSEVMRIEGHPWYQRELTAWCERFAAQHADRIVVASTYLRDLYRRQFPKKPIHLMPNGVEAEWLAPITVPSITVPAVATPAAGKRIVFMGAINRKSILEPLFDIFPEVLKQHPDADVLIIGDGKFLPYFKEKAKKLGIEKNITFTGWLALDDARARLRVGDIGYNYTPDEPTTNAASNMKLPQYMSRGVVPLVSRVGDLPASVDFGRAGYICKADDTLALRAMVLEALEDKERLQKAEHARIFADEKFNWDNLGGAFCAWLGFRPGLDKRIFAAKGRKKKIYVVTTTVPGDFGGGEIRNYNLIKQLVQQADAEVDVFCIATGNDIAVRKNFESSTNARCHAVPAHTRTPATAARALFLERVPPFMDDFKWSGVGDLLRRACEDSLPDAVQIEQLQAYYCIRPHLAWLKSRGVKIIFDCHNIEFQSFNDSLEIFSLPKKLVGKFLVPHLKKLEIEAVRCADMIFACSMSDADFFKKYNTNTFVIPNGVDCTAFQPSAKKENPKPVLIFMGAAKYPPNGDAIQFYLNDIHRKIKERVPSVRVLVIGTDQAWLDAAGLGAATATDAADESIQPFGFVDDVRPYLAQAIIGICPLRYGSGTRLKILTYLAAGLPVVSTQKGAEGVNYVDGQDVVLADEPATFADAVVALLHDPKAREDMSRHGRQFVVDHYDWNVIGKNLAQIYHHEFIQS